MPSWCFKTNDRNKWNEQTPATSIGCCVSSHVGHARSQGFLNRTHNAWRAKQFHFTWNSTDVFRACLQLRTQRWARGAAQNVHTDQLQNPSSEKHYTHCNIYVLYADFNDRLLYKAWWMCVVESTMYIQTDPHDCTDCARNIGRFDKFLKQSSHVALLYIFIISEIHDRNAGYCSKKLAGVQRRNVR